MAAFKKSSFAIVVKFNMIYIFKANDELKAGLIILKNFTTVAKQFSLLNTANTYSAIGISCKNWSIVIDYFLRIRLQSIFFLFTIERRLR